MASLTRKKFYKKVYALSKLTGLSVHKIVDRAKRLYFEEYVQEYEWPLLDGIDKLAYLMEVWCAKKGWSENRLMVEVYKWWLAGMLYFDIDLDNGGFEGGEIYVRKGCNGSIEWFDVVRASKGLLPALFEVRDIEGVKCRVTLGALHE